MTQLDAVTYLLPMYVSVWCGGRGRLGRPLRAGVKPHPHPLPPGWVPLARSLRVPVALTPGVVICPLYIFFVLTSRNFLGLLRQPNPLCAAEFAIYGAVFSPTHWGITHEHGVGVCPVG